MKFKEFLQNNVVITDGATGTVLIEKGLKTGEYPERLNLTAPEIVTEVHREYFDAGSNVVLTNTFGANSLKFGKTELDKIIKAAIENAKKAKKQSVGKQEKFIALDIGPTGKLLKPLGDLDFEDAVNIFKNTVKIGVKYGVDLVFIETMNDGYEAKAAVLAVKECCDLPVIVSNVYNSDKKTLTGTTPKAISAMMEGLNVDGYGANCSLGPKELSPVMDELLKYSSKPVLFKPNAGLPKVIDGKTVYDVSVKGFVNEVYKKVVKGVRIVGGCCGTSPKFISALSEKLKDFKPNPIKNKEITLISSYLGAVEFNKPVIIGERINPTGKKRFKQALIENDIGYILNEAVKEETAGAEVLDVNVGIPDIDESKVLPSVIKEIQGVTGLPLQIDTSNTKALEKALRIYNGKPLINSVNGKKESMDAVFPLAKKYGGVIVCLTLDEKGIPENAKDRVKIALKIEKEAKKYGIDKKDLIFDTLTMAVSSDKNAAKTTLTALKTLSETGYNTVLGVSNVSFGLPSRDYINASFYNSALTCGLTAGIINPFSEEMIKTYKTFMALNGYDENCGEYISYASGVQVDKKETSSENLTLKDCIIKGFKEDAAKITRELLKSGNPLDIINSQIIPALDEVGKNYEQNKIYLPQLLISAESAKCAFEEIKSKSVQNGKSRCKVVLATVKGDIHDIGKNIVKLLLSNYGFDVIDLGKDVMPDIIVKEIVSKNIKICGLSALMTTTVPNMEETIKLIRKKAPDCKVIVGGAVLTKEYAEKINADFYAKDAMETVKICLTLDK